MLYKNDLHVQVNGYNVNNYTVIEDKYLGHMKSKDEVLGWENFNLIKKKYPSTCCDIIFTENHPKCISVRILDGFMTFFSDDCPGLNIIFMNNYTELEDKDIRLDDLLSVNDPDIIHELLKRYIKYNNINDYAF